MTNTNSKSSKSRRKKNKDNVSASGDVTLTALTLTSPSPSEIKSTSDLKGKHFKPEMKKLTFLELQLLQNTVLEFINSNVESRELLGLSNLQRKEIHSFARKHGLKTRSRSNAGDRILTLTRGESTSSIMRRQEIKLQLSSHSIIVMNSANKTLSQKRRPPTLVQQRSARVHELGGLLGTPRIPPRTRGSNLSLDAERRELPIFVKRDEIFELLEMSQVLIVNGATGSGKSTQLPQFLLEDAAERKEPIRIVVSQPRRVAAISVSGRIADERNEISGDTVGYVIRMESKCSSNTLLTFTTSGCLLRTLTMNGQEFFGSTTHLVIDEVHDRDLDTDLLLLACKMELARNKSLKLILMSATMDFQALSTYFDNAPVLDVEGRSFNVRTFGLEDVLKISGYMTPNMLHLLGSDAENSSKEDICKAYEQVHHMHVDISENDIDNALIVSLVQLLLLIGSKGAVIIYLPGYTDMTKLMDMMNDALPGNMVKILLLHSQVDSRKQREVFGDYPNVQLKIVLSTNIGQTSITIPDLLYVIDTGRVKMKTYDARTGASQLSCVWISQADAQQRTGRAGRRKDGICYRLYSNQLYETFSCFSIPEIKRHTLDEVCLLAKIAAPNQDIQQFLELALDPPLSSAVAQSSAKLKLLRVLNDEDESVTELGHILSELPLDVQLGKCLVYGLYYQCAGSLIIITAFYSVRDPFVLADDPVERSEQRKSRENFSVDSCSDSIGILLLYKNYRAAIKKSNNEVNKFCKTHGLCSKSMELFDSAVYTLRKTLKRIFKINDLEATNRYNDEKNMVRLALTAGLYPKIVYIDRSKSTTRFVEEGDPRVQLSRNSCLNHPIFKRRKSYLSDWVVYVEKTRNAGPISNIEHTTLVSSLMVGLQCGKVAKLQHILPTSAYELDGDNVEQSVLLLDSCLRITMTTEVGEKLLQLRSHIEREFFEMVNSRTVETTRCPSVTYVQIMLELHSEESGLSADDIVVSSI